MSNVPAAKKLTATQKHQLMTKAMSTLGGRQKIAASLAQPLRFLRDYQSIARRAFMIDELPDGALPIYDTDPSIPAFVVGEEADSIQTVVKSKRLLVPMFELASNPTIPFTQVKERRFDVVKRIKEKSRVEIFRREDRLLFGVMNAAAAKNTALNLNPTITVALASFNIGVLADAFARIESNGLPVDKIFMNPAQFPVIRKAGRDYLDFETQREILRTGMMGILWGAQVLLSMEVPKGAIFLCTEPEYFGVLPVRIDLTVIPADLPAHRAFGWSVFQQIGCGLHNAANGLQKIQIT